MQTSYHSPSHVPQHGGVIVLPPVQLSACRVTLLSPSPCRWKKACTRLTTTTDGPLAHMLCLVYQEEHLMTQWLTAHSKNMDLAGCPEVKGSPLLGAVGEGHLLEISLLYCAQHVATIMPAILPCPCTGRKNT